jgi:DNA-binding Lrp family transcriptional regulator
VIYLESPKQKKTITALDKIDLKIIDILQKERKELTLKEIANKTGEKPQEIIKSIWKLFVHNEKILNEKLLQIYI